MSKRPSIWLLAWIVSAALSITHCGAATDSALFGPDEDASIGPDAQRPDDAAPDDADRQAVAPAGLEATQVVTGEAHSCAVDAAGRVFCWGSNAFGQLGVALDVATTTAPRQVELPSGLRAVQLAAGAEHTCALTDRKNLVCWGRNDVGQVARPASAVAAPDLVTLPSTLATADFVGLAAGRAHTCAIYIVPQIGDGGDVDAALDDVRRMVCWGANDSGQLARDDVPFAELPADVKRSGTGGASVVARLAALGNDFSVASLRSTDGYRVQSWGSPAGGVFAADLDAGVRVNPLTVLEESGGPLQDPQALQAGARHACALLDVADSPEAGAADAEVDAADAGFEDAGAATARSIACWGQNDRGQLGQGAASPTELPRLSALPGASALALGGEESCVLLGGTLRCAGANEFGQLGLGTFDSSAHATFEAVQGLGGIVQSASVGARHVCALVQTAAQVLQVQCWGDNSDGQLGDGLSLGSGYADAAVADRTRRAHPVFVTVPD